MHTLLTTLVGVVGLAGCVTLGYHILVERDSSSNLGPIGLALCVAALCFAIPLVRAERRNRRR
jgi:hypothetical protein